MNSCNTDPKTPISKSTTLLRGGEQQALTWERPVARRLERGKPVERSAANV